MDRVNILLPLRATDVKKIRTTLKRRRFEFAALLHIPPKGRQTVRYYPDVHGAHRAPLAGHQGMDPR